MQGDGEVFYKVEVHIGSILRDGGCRYAFCYLCSGHHQYQRRSDDFALVADVDFGKEMVQLYKERLASDRCIEALTRAVCAYHFPLCTNDIKEHGKICRYLSAFSIKCVPT
jgi:hypothetical protein